MRSAKINRPEPIAHLLRYSTILFDFDHTLFDSDGSESSAFAHALDQSGIPNTAEMFENYQRINLALWKQVELGLLEPAVVGTRRFEEFVGQMGLDANPGDMAYTFGRAMGAEGCLYPGVREILEKLADVASLALITNGIGAIQRARIDRLAIADYFDAIVISGEVGTSKPGSAIFELVFAELGNPPKETAVIIGDSLNSDIKGGSDFGIDTVWYNSNGALAGPDDRITHEIADLAELLPLSGYVA